MSVVTLVPDYTNVPVTLRRIADGMENGMYPSGMAVLTTYSAEGTEVYMLGKGQESMALTIGILEMAKIKLLT